MSKDIYKKIQYLCKTISKVEWSGILLYSVEGTITDPGNMIITLQDIIPMHKGTVTATSYKFNEKKRDTKDYEDKHIEYVMEHEEAVDWKVGHIHSHNSMNTYFSNVDMEELQDNSPAHNYYLSFIVNNFMEFQAKVAVMGEVNVKVPQASYEALDSEGNTYSLHKEDLSFKKNMMFVYDCDIEVPYKEPIIGDSFAKSVQDIISKAESTKVKSIPGKKFIKNKPGNNSNYNPHSFFQQPSSQHWDKYSQFTDIEEFIMTLLEVNFTEPTTIRDIEDAFEEFQALNVVEKRDSIECAKNLVTSYFTTYERCFDIGGTEHFVQVTEEVIEVFESHEAQFDFLTELIASLKFLVSQTEQTHGS